MNPTGLISPRCIGAFACVVGLVVEQVLQAPARRVMWEPLGLSLVYTTTISMFSIWQD